MEKALVDTLTAVDALRERRGECQSHTYFIHSTGSRGGHPHQSCERTGLFRRLRWLSLPCLARGFCGSEAGMDPTLGQDSVDATHIKLTENEREDPLKLMEFVGRVGIEIVE